jgi:hypothetical protein
MKISHYFKFPRLGAASLVGLLALAAHAQLNVDQINWGSQDFSQIVDNEGNTLSQGNFFFALGAFETGFTPTEENRYEWASNFVTFDFADYNAANGVFTGEYSLYDNTYTSQSGFTIDSTGSNFEALGISRDAYIWVYNDLNPEPGSEWFLARAGSTTENPTGGWQFPTVTGNCCNNDPPLEWSMSDLDSTDTPLWGNQFNTEGNGVRDIQDTNADLQTYTFIPEPSTALLVAMAGMFGVMRRSRRRA